MKRKKPKNPRSLGEVTERTKLKMVPDKPHVGRRPRQWIFRIFALALPVAGLVGLEILLRLVGYGYSDSFFLKSTVEGKPAYVANLDFTKRFFPPGLVRTPQPLVLPAMKSPDSVRIFIFGESAAMGDPAPAYGFGRVLEVLLRERYSRRRIEMANVATTAINSFVLREIAKDCVSREGDIWILYMGNNEVIGPYGAGTIFSDAGLGLPAIRAQVAFKGTRLGQAMESLRLRWAGNKGAPATWEGMEMFLDRQLRYNDPAMDQVYAHFESNLEDMVRMAAKRGAKVLLCTVVSNLRDCPPFGSLPATAWTPERRAIWDRSVAAGDRLFEEGKPAEALVRFHEAEQVEAGMACLSYRIGQCHLELGDETETKKALVKARDLDTLRFRADTRLNQVIRQVGVRQKSPAVAWLDAEEIFSKQYPHGVIGGEFLYEHVHLNAAGNYLLGRAMAEALAPWIGPKSAATPGAGVGAGEWLRESDCEARLALTDWDRARILEEMIKRLEQPPFNQQSGHAVRHRRMQDTLALLQARATPENARGWSAMYEAALRLAPNDWILHDQFAEFLEDWNRLPESAEHWRRVVALVPNHYQARYQLANVLDKQGRSAEAVTEFEEALRQAPQMHEARNGLGLALAGIGRTNDALTVLESTLRVKPDFADARVNLGQLLSRLGRDTEAMAQYELALHYRSNNVAALINLGRLLVSRQQFEAAEQRYREALRLAPSNAILHFNLGNLLADRKSPEALSHYALTVAIDPAFAEARLNYGMELAQQGQTAAALAQFQETVRLRPDMPEARFTLGVALAKQRRFREAIEQFQETLRLEPDNATARQFLQQAQSMLRQGE